MNTQMLQGRSDDPEANNIDSRFNWHLPLYAAMGAFAVFIPLAKFPSDLALFGYLFAILPIISVFLLIYAIRKGRQQRSSKIAMLITYWIVSAILIANYSAVRQTTRWWLWSRDYKVKVLKQPPSPNGELSHVEWDSWGMFAQDTSVFLVFDPTNSLTNHRFGKFKDIPCQVPDVRRLQNHWYAVQFYTDEYWDQCGSS
jgi:hypothetical protein